RGVAVQQVGQRRAPHFEDFRCASHRETELAENFLADESAGVWRPHADLHRRVPPLRSGGGGDPGLDPGEPEGAAASSMARRTPSNASSLSTLMERNRTTLTPCSASHA